MFDYKRLIKKSFKSHTFFTDVFGYCLIKAGFADKYLAGQVTMYRAYHWLNKRFKYESEKPKQIENNLQSKPETDYVWICWLQGMDSAPDIVKACYKSICYWLNDKKIVVITKENYSEYVSFPEYIIEKWKSGIITNTHFSDLLRLELLIKYGGLWLDATTYITGPIPDYVYINDFFVYRNGWMDMDIINMASWLIYSRNTNNILLLETRRLLYIYWKKYKYIKNYFLLHMFFRMVTDKYKDEWAKVPYINQIEQHLFINELSKPFDEKRFSEIKKLSSVHKLTYKNNVSNDKYLYHKLDYLFKN